MRIDGPGVRGSRYGWATGRRGGRGQRTWPAGSIDVREGTQGL